jgi:hypothetical protein
MTKTTKPTTITCSISTMCSSPFLTRGWQSGRMRIGISDGIANGLMLRLLKTGAWTWIMKKMELMSWTRAVKWKRRVG